MTGRTLAHYQVLEKLGAGGMGEVYKARDTRLGREVAIKVLPEGFARDPERLARFEREARLLASLNHPNIAAIYGFEHVEGIPFLVLEYVPGEILKGPLPLEETAAIARQVTEALEHAHDKAIVHRDLKPANIKITPQGKVKVLDFGLAKAFLDEREPTGGPQSPTLSLAATRAGVILGTAAYLSPEQARGRGVDRRTDIWAFGCVLYEMLAGKQAFPAETISDAIAGILAREPDWSALPAATPERVRELLRRCLEKDLERRLRHIDDARFQLEEAEPSLALPAPPALKPPRWKQVLPWALAGVAIAIAAWSVRPAPKPVPRPLMRFSIDQPGERVGALALSRDGARLAFTHATGGQRTGGPIYLRALDQPDAKPVPGSDGGWNPFFSPDGQWLGFIADGKLKKVSVAGGGVISLCDAGNFPLAAVWGPDEHIVFTTAARTGLSRVSASGGVPQVLTTLDKAKGETTHRPSDALPGGRALLFTIGTGEAGSGGPPTPQNAHVAILDLRTGQRRTLIQGAVAAAYVPTGHLVYFAQERFLFAAPFDLDRLQVTGPGIPILEGVGAQPGAYREFAFSDSGVLVYLPTALEADASALMWVDRKGTVQPLAAPPRLYHTVALSPDGQRVAVAILREAGVFRGDIWMYDLARGTLTRLTSGGAARNPVWTPDGMRLTFASVTEGKPSVASVPADGSGAPQHAPVESFYLLSSWSPDGKALTFDRGVSGRLSIWVVSGPVGGGDLKPRPFLQSQFRAAGAQFSPDGRWIAYYSDETGRNEVYVQPYPGPGGKWPVSTDGGAYPKWARNGRELFYRNTEKMMAVDVSLTPGFRAGTPKVLFEGRYGISYDVAPDGKRFLMTKSGDEAPARARIHVIVEWFEELRRRAPAR